MHTHAPPLGDRGHHLIPARPTWLPAAQCSASRKLPGRRRLRRDERDARRARRPALGAETRRRFRRTAVGPHPLRPVVRRVQRVHPLCLARGASAETKRQTGTLHRAGVVGHGDTTPAQNTPAPPPQPPNPSPTTPTSEPQPPSRQPPARRLCAGCRRAVRPRRHRVRPVRRRPTRPRVGSDDACLAPEHLPRSDDVPRRLRPRWTAPGEDPAATTHATAAAAHPPAPRTLSPHTLSTHTLSPHTIAPHAPSEMRALPARSSSPLHLRTCTGHLLHSARVCSCGGPRRRTTVRATARHPKRTKPHPSGHNTHSAKLVNTSLTEMPHSDARPASRPVAPHSHTLPQPSPLSNPSPRWPTPLASSGPLAS